MPFTLKGYTQYQRFGGYRVLLYVIFFFAHAFRELTGFLFQSSWYVPFFPPQVSNVDPSNPFITLLIYSTFFFNFNRSLSLHLLSLYCPLQANAFLKLFVVAATGSQTYTGLYPDNKHVDTPLFCLYATMILLCSIPLTLIALFVSILFCLFFEFFSS